MRERKGKDGKHKPVDHWKNLVARMKTWLLSPQDERQSWAQFIDTGDEEVRQRLINSCAKKCLFYARKMPEQERWDAFMVLWDEVGRIVDQRKFDPDQAALPTFVEKILALRIKDIKKGIRTRAKLFDQIDPRESAVDSDDDTPPAEVEMVEADAVDETNQLAARLDHLLAHSHPGAQAPYATPRSSWRNVSARR